MPGRPDSRWRRQSGPDIVHETPDAREARLQVLRDNQAQRLSTETPDAREPRLQVARDNQAQRLSTETPDAREARLQVLRDNQAQRLSTETPDAREARLQVLRDNQAQRLSTETPDAREARLQVARDNQARRLSIETPDGRHVRLQVLSSNQARRLSSETHSARDARISENQRRSVETREQGEAGLQRMREQVSYLPSQPLLFDQPSVRAKMLKFHSDIAGIDCPKCSVCLEQFPGMKLHSSSTECLRCYRDKHIPKMYSAANNMDPGPVPSELKVSIHPSIYYVAV